MTRRWTAPTRRLLAGGAVVALAVSGLSGCRPKTDPARRSPLPHGAPVVTVTMREFRFSYDEASVPAGRVVFRFVNAGKLNHRPSLLRLADDLPPLDEQLRGSQRRPVSPYAGISERRPGTKASFAVDLVAGARYGLICFVREPDGTSHALKGMNVELRPGADVEAPSKPTQRLQMRLVVGLPQN